MGEIADEIIDRMIFGPYQIPKRKKKRGYILATEYPKFIGNVKWAKVYTADETPFGAVRYSMNFYPRDAEEWDKIKPILNPKKKIKEDRDTGEKYIDLFRNKTQNIKGKLVTFTPPHIYDVNGDVICSYVYEDSGKKVYSYDGDTKIKRIGEPVLIGNGSEVEVTLAVFSTGMGNGNRIQSIKVLDLVEFNPDAPKDDDPDEDEQEQTDVTKDADGAPWE